MAQDIDPLERDKTFQHISALEAQVRDLTDKLVAAERERDEAMSDAPKIECPCKTGDPCNHNCPCGSGGMSGVCRIEGCPQMAKIGLNTLRHEIADLEGKLAAAEQIQHLTAAQVERGLAALREATAGREAAEAEVAEFTAGKVYSAKQVGVIEPIVDAANARAEAAEAALAVAREALEGLMAQLRLPEGPTPDGWVNAVEQARAALQDEATALRPLPSQPRSQWCNACYKVQPHNAAEHCLVCGAFNGGNTVPLPDSEPAT